MGVRRRLFRRKGGTRFFLFLRFFRTCNALNLPCFFRRVILVIERLLQILLQVLNLRDVARDWQIAQRHGFALIRTLWRRE